MVEVDACRLEDDATPSLAKVEASHENWAFHDLKEIYVLKRAYSDWACVQGDIREVEDKKGKDVA